MPACHHNLSRMKHLASVLMLLAIILRSAVPQGWMPVADESGSFGTYAICSVTGTYRLALEGDGGPPPLMPDDGTLHPPCAFAGMATLSPHDAAPGLQAPAFAGLTGAIAIFNAPNGKRIIGAAAARAPPARTDLA